MKIVVAGSQSSWEELKGDNKNIEWIKVENVAGFNSHKDADAFFNLDNNAAKADYPAGLAVLFINSVITPLKEMQQYENMIRINAWKGFLNRSTWEVAGTLNPSIEKILDAIGKKATPVADEPGFISARILAMIINEAYFAKGEDVSTESEIDIAMRLGTNYPKGPFEWAGEIGKENIYSLLDKLKDSDKRYMPAPLLEKESFVL